MKLTEPAPAKINLALHIRRKRPDGYHDLETLFAFAHDGDVVTVEAAAQDGFAITGPFAGSLRPAANPVPSPTKAGAQSGAQGWTPAFAGEGEKTSASAGAGTGAGADDNLVLRAAAAFRKTFGIARPYAITLEKNLPIASGIGGGSADAAAALRALATLHAIDPADLRLVAIARTLGADVPACLLGRTAFATGRGDDLGPLPPLGDIPLLLVNPGVPLSTTAMFASWDGVDRGPLATGGSALDRARVGRNDFTVPAIGHAPVVADVLKLLTDTPGSTFARLSGSGATCFALFADAAARDSAANEAQGRGWWALATAVR